MAGLHGNCVIPSLGTIAHQGYNVNCIVLRVLFTE